MYKVYIHTIYTYTYNVRVLQENYFPVTVYRQTFLEKHFSRGIFSTCSRQESSPWILQATCREFKWNRGNAQSTRYTTLANIREYRTKPNWCRRGAISPAYIPRGFQSAKCISSRCYWWPSCPKHFWQRADKCPLRSGDSPQLPKRNPRLQ